MQSVQAVHFLLVPFRFCCLAPFKPVRLAMAAAGGGCLPNKHCWMSRILLMGFLCVGGGTPKSQNVAVCRCTPDKHCLQLNIHGMQVPHHKARVVVAGPATSCSQKLHNILEGLVAAAPGSEYALCLDDDIQVSSQLHVPGPRGPHSTQPCRECQAEQAKLQHCRLLQR